MDDRRDDAACDWAVDDPFPPSEAHLRWQAESEACAAERERELALILQRVAARTHTRADVQRLVRELDLRLPPEGIPPDLPRRPASGTSPTGAIPERTRVPTPSTRPHEDRP